MFKNIFLIGLIFFMSFEAEAMICREVFQSSNRSAKSIFSQAFELTGWMEKLELFHRSRRARIKEIKHIHKDLDGVKDLLQKNSKSTTIDPMVLKWEKFNDFWLAKLKEFESLPKKKQDLLRSYLELPLSLSTKHFISFLEASHHRQWNLNRLIHLLTLFEKKPDLDVEAALFLFHREVLRFTSRWDFIRCRY